jgi:uncharacterized protein (DUF1810 family)/N-acetylglutamate synthase-like GNAT family acetyltransferase
VLIKANFPGLEGMSVESIGLDAEVEALLVEAGLPVSDLSGSHDCTLLGVREGGRLVGVAGIEVHGSVGLLRSVAVTPARRNDGLGLNLVSNAEAWAAGHGLESLYLLTTTAAGFFARLGYEVTPRSEAPAAIAATPQFARLCPRSATFMRKVMAPRDAFDLQRFVAAQSGGTHECAVNELRNGRKRSHWMWFIFPQLKGLGHSATAVRYGISGLAGARAYLAHPVLGERLRQCADALEALDPGPSATDIFGSTDALKLRSSLTLFAEAAGPGSIFERLLGKYFDGQRDELTLRMLEKQLGA